MNNQTATTEPADAESRTLIEKIAHALKEGGEELIEEVKELLGIEHDEVDEDDLTVPPAMD